MASPQRLAWDQLIGVSPVCDGATRQMADVVTLAAHGFDLGLLPELGGSVAWLNWTGPDRRAVPLLRPSDADAIASGNPSRLACFPLVPFANRIAGSRFVFGGRQHRLPEHPPPDPLASPGLGFQAAWAAEAIGPAADPPPPH